MARFRFRWPGRPHPVLVRRTLAALSPRGDSDAPLGPGWFDSSWDLKRGLVVREGAPSNPSVSEWLMVCLSERP